MISPSANKVCSTGFSIRLSGVTHTITARHCTAGDHRARDGSARYGAVVRNTRWGGARILGDEGSAFMFDGAYNDASGYKKTVIGFGDVSLGDKVCTSGGNSGVHCDISVDAMVVRWNDGQGEFDTIHGHRNNPDHIAIIQGDSGGPVLDTAGTGKVLAVGMIQALNEQVSNCGRVRDGGGNLCGRGVLFSAMRTIVNGEQGAATLVTG